MDIQKLKTKNIIRECYLRILVTNGFETTGINPETRMKSQFPLDNFFFFAIVSVFVISPCPVLFSKFLSILRREIIVM